MARPAARLLAFANGSLRRLSARTHHLQGALEGRFDRRRMWFDHYVDMYWKLPATGDAMFLERAMFNRLFIGPEADVLELACGDGYYAAHFYGPSARSVLATDIDPSAIAFARRRNARPNVRYQVHDIREGLPDGSFTHVIWDGAMMFLDEAQLETALVAIRERIGPAGKLTGYTATEPEDKEFVRHRVGDSEALTALLGRHFPHVTVLSTEHAERTNFYFAASASALEITTGRLASFPAQG